MREFTDRDLDRRWSRRELGGLSDKEFTTLAFRRATKELLFFTPIAAVIYLASINLGFLGHIIGWVGVCMFVVLALSDVPAVLTNLFVVVATPFHEDIDRAAKMFWRTAQVSIAVARMLASGAFAVVIYTATG